MITGVASLPLTKTGGFSFIEVLVSLLILSTGFVTCTELLTRIQFVQFQSNQSLKALLMLDYMASKLAIATEACQPSSQQKTCQIHSPKVAGNLFDGFSSLLEGYVDLDPVTSANYGSCISYINDKTYVIGIIRRGASTTEQTSIACTASNFLWLTRYKAL